MLRKYGDVSSEKFCAVCSTCHFIRRTEILFRPLADLDFHETYTRSLPFRLHILGLFGVRTLRTAFFPVIIMMMVIVMLMMMLSMHERVAFRLILMTD